MQSEKRYMGWDEYESKLYDLYSKIAEQYQPTHVVGIGRGGLIPGTCLSHLFKVPLSPIIIQSYVGQEQHEVHYEENLDILTKLQGKLLVVDDLVDNGLTMIRVRDRIQQAEQAEQVKFATIFHKVKSKLVPDFYCQITDNWIVFPWEHGYYKHKWSFFE